MAANTLPANTLAAPTEAPSHGRVAIKVKPTKLTLVPLGLYRGSIGGDIGKTLVWGLMGSGAPFLPEI